MFQPKKRLRQKMLATTMALGLCLSISSSFVSASAAKDNLIVGATQGIPQLNPIIRTLTYEDTLFPLLWSALTKYKENGEVGPDLALSWSSNDAATEWTFKLRPRATFSDGSPINADAVKAVFDYALDPKTVTQERNKIAMISSITTSGSQIVFKLNSPNGFFPAAITNIKMIKVAEVPKFNVNPTSSGPYMVKSFNPNVSVTMVKNPKYYGLSPKMNEIKFVVSGDATAAVTSLRAGDIDVLWQLPLAAAAPLKSDKNLRIVKARVSTTAVTWEFDTKSAPFNNIKARQALAYSVNRAAIAKSAYFGYGKVSSLNSIIPDKSIWNCGTEGGLTQYTYDLQKAKALFEEAGVSEFTWWGRSDARPEFDAMGQILQASLKTIGIKVNIVNVDRNTWLAKFYPAGKTYPGVVLPNFQSNPSEPAFGMNFLLSGRAESNWNNSTYDALYKKAIGIPSVSQRKIAWCEVQKLENKELPLITPIVYDVLHGARANVRGAWVEGGGQLHLDMAYLN